jgi:hypothetical protein
MEKKREQYLEHEKHEAVILFALVNGWKEDWLKSNRESSEILYGREFTMEEVAMHLAAYSGFEIDTKDYLRIDFLKSFFARHPNVAIEILPDISFVAMPVTPHAAVKERSDEAWKYHIRNMVFLEASIPAPTRGRQSRLDYLFEFVPLSLAEKMEERRRERMKKISNY